MRKSFMPIAVLLMSSCVLQTEAVPGPQGEQGPEAPPLDDSKFMRRDMDTGTVGSMTIGGNGGIGAEDPIALLHVVEGGTLLEGEGPDIGAATLIVRNTNPTHGGFSAILDIEQEAPTPGTNFYFLRTRTTLGGLSTGSTDKFFVASDGSGYFGGTGQFEGHVGIGVEAIPNAGLTIVDSGEHILLSHSAGWNAYLDVDANNIFSIKDGSLNSVLRIDLSSGSVVIGPGITTPKATLDVNGTVRLGKYATAPVPCDAAHDGTIALQTTYAMCVCNGNLGQWVRTGDGMTPCGW